MFLNNENLHLDAAMWDRENAYQNSAANITLFPEGE
jgi:hypothetical protein